jgi:hypothetical protein
VDDEISVTVVGSQPEAELAYHRPTSYAAGAGDGLVSLGSPREIVVLARDAGRARELLADA